MEVSISGKKDKKVKRALETLKNYSLEVSDDPDIVISVGGDGSTIYAFKNYNRPVLPVRLKSNLGFLSDVPFSQLEKAYEKMERGEYYIERFLLLDLFKNGKRLTSSMNEVSLQQKDPRKAARFDIYADGNPLFDFPIISDGVIVSTPIGSTAYNSSIGGHLVNPKHEKIVVSLKAQSGIKSRKRLSKILESTSEIEMELFRPEEFLVAVDGYDIFTVRASDELSIKKSEDHFKLVKIKGMEESWHKKLKRKKKYYSQKMNN